MFRHCSVGVSCCARGRAHSGTTRRCARTVQMRLGQGVEGGRLRGVAMMSFRNRVCILGLVFLAYSPPAWWWWREKGERAERTFVVPAPSRVLEEKPDFKTELIALDPLVPSVHVASVCETPEGRLCAAWYGGSHEGARDVNIFLSMRPPGGGVAWSKPQTLVSRASAMQELRRPIKKVGNAMLFAEGNGQLKLLYVTGSVGGWSTRSLNLKISRDCRQTWMCSRRVTMSPFFNLSELVKNKPCAISDGSWAVPIYHECLAKFPEVLWLQETAPG